MSPMRSGRNTHGRGRARLAERACTPGAAGADGGGSAEPSPNGGNGVIRATTRRRHAANQLLMLQNPHRIRCNERQTDLVGPAAAPADMAAVPVGGGSSTPGHTDGATAGQNSPNKNHAGPLRYKTRPTRTMPGHCGTKLAQHESHNPTSGTKLTQHTHSHRMCETKLALLAQNGPFWRVLPMHGELSTAVTTNKPRRANFVPNTSWMRE